MQRLPLILLLFLSATVCSAQELRPVWSPAEVQSAPQFTGSQKIVGTHYFYWYDYPGQHFFDDGAMKDDALQDHFPNPEIVSFNSIEWHDKQIEDIAAAGIDFIIPVYWGVVDNYFLDGMVFSIRGLGPLQTAIERRQRAGKPVVKIGMFYDTSTLLPGMRGDSGDRYDLREAKGKDIFYRTIRDFFYQIKPSHWATIDGHPLVVLYGSGFVKSHDQSTVDYVYQKFQQDFGIRPYIIRDNSWHFTSDATTSWGAALGQPNIFGKVAQIGPGYNDSAVPSRTTPIREREDGAYYRFSWNQVLSSKANIVLLETWNEMHEGTDICDSAEFGRKYIDLTREYITKFKNNEPATETIELKYPEPRPRPADTEGQEYKGAQRVEATLGINGVTKGLRVVRSVEDGGVRDTEIEGVKCTRTVTADNTYMYFSIVDPFYFDEQIPVAIEYTYLDANFSRMILEYDSYDRRATLSGAYKSTTPVTCGNTNQWKTYRVEIQDARFVNRENGGSDFRIAVLGGWLAMKDIKVEKLATVQE